MYYTMYNKPIQGYCSSDILQILPTVLLCQWYISQGIYSVRRAGPPLISRRGGHEGLTTTTKTREIQNKTHNWTKLNQTMGQTPNIFPPKTQVKDNLILIHNSTVKVWNLIYHVHTHMVQHMYLYYTLYAHIHVRLFKVGSMNVFSDPLIIFSDNSSLRDAWFLVIQYQA